MSANNHDNDDPNNVGYAKTKAKSTETQEVDKDLMVGRAIKIYKIANTRPLKDFLKWFETEYKTYKR